MTQANEHLTPKSLDEHVPGAWNFIEPPPTPKLDRLVQIAEPAFFVQPRLTLSPEQREKLLSLFPCNPSDITADGDREYWEMLEDALVEMLAPQRYVTGVAQPAPWLSDPHAP